MSDDGLVPRLLAPSYLLACIVLGGSSAGGLLANGLLQLGGIVVVALCLYRGVLARLTRPAHSLLLIVGLAATWLTVSLVSLPAGWSAWGPGRTAVAQGLALLGAAPRLALSLAPDRTVTVLLSFIPPLAMFLAVSAASSQSRRDGAILLCAAALVSIVFGVLQQLGGYRSDLYLYAITSRGGATGFFANRNHLATLALMALPFATALASGAMSPLREGERGVRLVAFAILLFLAVGAVAVQSLFGWLMLPPTLIACLWLYRRQTGERGFRWLGPVAGVALVVALLAAFSPLGTIDAGRTEGEIAPQQRRHIASATAEAAAKFLPLGSGLGTFQLIYPAQEDPAVVTPTFVNHAHNEYLELALEGGVFGLALLAAFLIWFARHAMRIWRGAASPLAAAATIALAVVLAHGLVDYPIRTAAIAAAAAFACALLCARPDKRRGSLRLSSSPGRAPSSEPSTRLRSS